MLVLISRHGRRGRGPIRDVMARVEVVVGQRRKVERSRIYRRGWRRKVIELSVIIWWLQMLQMRRLVLMGLWYLLRRG